MRPWLHKLERFADKAIPYVLLLLIYIIIADIFFKEYAEHHHIQLMILDGIVITIFVIDLSFKYNRTRKIPKFLKKYWLDIIAVFPFFLFFRILEETFLLSEAAVSTVQKFLHAGVEIEKESVLIAESAGKVAEEASKLTKEAAKVTRVERFTKAGRTGRFARFFRPIARVPRFIKAFAYYEKPKKRKH